MAEPSGTPQAAPALAAPALAALAPYARWVDASSIVCTVCNAKLRTTGWRSQPARAHIAAMHYDDLAPGDRKAMFMELAAAAEGGAEVARDATSDAARDATSDAGVGERGRTSSSAAPRRRAAVDKAFLAWILADKHSFRAVEGDGMKALLAALRPDVALPSRRTIAQLVPEIKRGLLSDVRTAITHARSVSLTVDHWPAAVHGDRGRPFLGVTVTTISPAFTMSTQLVAMRASPKLYNPTSLSAAIHEVAASVGVAPDGVASVITDRRACVPGGLAGFFGAARGTHAVCFGEMLTRVWIQVLPFIVELGDVVYAVRELALLYCQSPARRAILMAKCAQVNITPKRLLFPVSTHWWSDVHMLERALYLLLPLRIVDTSSFPDPSDEVRIKHAECVSALLQHKDLLTYIVLPIASTWEAWQVRLSSTTEPTAHLVATAVLQCMAAPYLVTRSAAFRNATIPNKAGLEYVALCFRYAVKRKVYLYVDDLFAGKRYVAETTPAYLVRMPVQYVAAAALHPATFDTPRRYSTWTTMAMNCVVDLALHLQPAAERDAGAAAGAALTGGDAVMLTGTTPKQAMEAAYRTYYAWAAAWVDSKRGDSFAAFWSAFVDEHGSAPCVKYIVQSAMRIMSMQPQATMPERVFLHAGNIAAGRPTMRHDVLSDVVFVATALGAAGPPPATRAAAVAQPTPAKRARVGDAGSAPSATAAAAAAAAATTAAAAAATAPAPTAAAAAAAAATAAEDEPSTVTAVEHMDAAMLEQRTEAEVDELEALLAHGLAEESSVSSLVFNVPVVDPAADAAVEDSVAGVVEEGDVDECAGASPHKPGHTAPPPGRPRGGAGGPRRPRPAAADDDEHDDDDDDDAIGPPTY